MKVFADNLRHRAEALNLSGAEVARRAGLEERRYGNYVTGRREPDLATLLRIAEALGSSVDQLLTPKAQDKAPDRLEILKQRLSAAASVLSEDDLRRVVIQVEALATSKVGA